MAISLISFPDEILLRIFQFASLEDSCAISGVCTRFRRLTLLDVKEFEAVGDRDYLLARCVILQVGEQLERLALSEVNLSSESLFSGCLMCVRINSLRLHYETVECSNWSLLIRRLGHQLDELVLTGSSLIPDSFCADYVLRYLSPDRLRKLTITLRKSDQLKSFCQNFSKLVFLDVTTYENPQFKLLDLLPNLETLRYTAKAPVDNFNWLRCEGANPYHSLKILEADCPMIMFNVRSQQTYLYPLKFTNRYKRNL